MTILALLPPKLLRHLQFLSAGRYDVIAAQSWKQTLQMIEDHAVGVVILDPSLESAGSLHDIEAVIAAYPSLPFLAYVPLNPAAFSAIAELSKAGLAQVVLYSHDDSAERFRVIVDKLHASPMTVRMLKGLRPKLNLLPLTLAKSVEEMFDEPHRYHSAHDLAATACLPVSRLYRSFQSVNLASPRRVLIASKLLRAYTYLSDPGQSVRGVSRKLGYRKSRLFSEQTHEVFGTNPSRLTERVTDTDALERLLEWCGAPTS